MKIDHYKGIFEGHAMQVLATAAKHATKFRDPYDWSSWTDQPAFWLVKEDHFYLMDAFECPEGFMPNVARAVHEQDGTRHMVDHYVVKLPIDRDKLEELIAGTYGLLVSITPDIVQYARYQRRPK